MAKRNYHIISPCFMCPKWFFAERFSDTPICPGCTKRETERRDGYLRKFDRNLEGTLRIRTPRLRNNT